MRILYDSKDKKFKTKFGTLRENEGCTINVYIPKSVPTVNVKLVFNRENGEMYSLYSMIKTDEYENYDIYSCTFSIAERGLYFYYFVIKTENEEFSLYKQGYDMTNMEEGELWQLSCVPKDFKVPEEYKGKIMYQIFPDRFCKLGDVNTEGKIKPFWVHNDMKDIPHYLPDQNGIVQNNDFFGGNIRGIISKLDYLKSLKVGVVYLNPIFKAYSNHRYDTADYKTVDEMLGNEEDFALLCREAHARDMKIILDGVFSHTGSNSIYFDSEKIFGNGALSNENSPYKEWYDFKNYPYEYTSWWGIKTLPCVDENNDSYRDYIIRDEDSVIVKWLRLGADGYRLDVADELPDSFILEMRNRMKEIKKDSFLIGEVWEDASNKSSYGHRRKYFTDGELDSVMNYPFRNAIINFVNGYDNGEIFKNTVMTVAENYPSDVVNCLMNLLSTHDTVRILSVFGGYTPKDKSERAIYRMDSKQRKNAIDKLFCAVFLQYVLPGMTSIYYGDEIGTEGFEDPFCRSYFDWDKIQDNNILDFYKDMSEIKTANSVLKVGDVRVEMLRNGVIKIDRIYGDNVLTAVINTGDEDYILYDTRDKIYYRNAEVEKEKIILKKMGFILQ